MTLQRPFQRSSGGTVVGTNFEVMGSRFYFLERKALLAFGAARLYGYTQEEALGRIAHELLKTEFPQDLADIEKTLWTDNVWEGEPEHRTRDGKRVVVASQWMLHRDPNGRATRILEVNMNEALELVRATLPASIEIRTAFGADLPKVCIDATQIYQVVINLTTNAAHAIVDHRGLIHGELEARTIGERDIQLYSEVPPGHYVRLRVSDNGCGMDAATVQRIFDPFFSTKPTGKGSGLGLSVVHGIAKAHHAILRVQSESGRGTTFLTYFPAVREADAAVRAPERTAPCGRGGRILFVDDEGKLLFVGATNLEQHGSKVTSLSDGEAAARALRQNPHSYDTVLTDLSMPGMSGLQLAGEIRKVLSDIPVILTSAYINPDDLNRAVRLGIQTVLIKPLNTKELLGTLANLFNRRSETQTN
jgi:CheY-like chemotaxis protein